MRARRTFLAVETIPYDRLAAKTDLNMTNWDEMDVDCEEDELSEVQAEFYSNALKEYNLALAEAAKIKKGGSVFEFEAV